MKLVGRISTTQVTALTLVALVSGSMTLMACSGAEQSDSTASALCASDNYECQEPTQPTTPVPTNTQVTCFRDADGDGLGSANVTKSFSTSCGTGYVAKSGDCDDSDAKWQGLKCYTDNDGDGKGGTLEAQLYCSSKTTCPAGHTTNANDCGSASSCMETSGNTSLYLSYFKMTLKPNDGGDAQVASGNADSLAGSSVSGTVSADGTFKFSKSTFIVKYVQKQYIWPYGDIEITTSIAATSDFSAKISTTTGAIATFSVPAKVSINARKVSDTGSGKTCSENAVTLKLRSASGASYNSSNGAFTLETAEAFPVDDMTGNSDALCGAINLYLPATGTISINAQAHDIKPVASWPALAAYSPGTAK